MNSDRKVIQWLTESMDRLRQAHDEVVRAKEGDLDLIEGAMATLSAALDRMIKRGKLEADEKTHEEAADTKKPKGKPLFIYRIAAQRDVLAEELARLHDVVRKMGATSIKVEACKPDWWAGWAVTQVKESWP